MKQRKISWRKVLCGPCLHINEGLNYFTPVLYWQFTTRACNIFCTTSCVHTCVCTSTHSHTQRSHDMVISSTITIGRRQAHESSYDEDVWNKGPLGHKSMLEDWYDIYSLCEFLANLIYSGFAAMFVRWEQWFYPLRCHMWALSGLIIKGCTHYLV